MNGHWIALAQQVSSDIVINPVSGIMGLAFKALASSGATPWWQALAQGGAWDKPLMTFTLTRYVILSLKPHHSNVIIVPIFGLDSQMIRTRRNLNPVASSPWASRTHLSTPETSSIRTFPARHPVFGSYL